MNTEQLSDKDLKVTSSDYGNDQQTEEVFDHPHVRRPQELIDALSGTSLLSDDEATAFVDSEIENVPYDYLQSVGVDVDSTKFESRETARKKIAEAIWIYELLSAYRFPDFPESCDECGGDIGGRWSEEPSEDEKDPRVLCPECGEVDEDPSF